MAAAVGVGALAVLVAAAAAAAVVAAAAVWATPAMFILILQPLPVALLQTLPINVVFT